MIMTVAATHATVIVMVKTNDGYWIGADGVRSNEGTHESLGPTCKIHEAHGWLLLKSGASQSSDRYGNDYSIDKKVRPALDGSQSMKSFETEIREQYKADLLGVIMNYIALLAPATRSEPNPILHKFSDPIRPDIVDGQHRVLTLIGYVSGLWINESLDAGIISYSDTGDPTFPYRFASRVSDWSPTSFSNGQMRFLAYPERQLPTSSHSDDWIVTHPKEAIKEVLEEAHKKFPSSVGPPYSIVHVTAARKSPGRVRTDTARVGMKIDWIEKGACPSWNTK